MLKFSKENTKTKKLRKVASLNVWLENKRKIYSLDLSSGYTCPGAQDCLSRVVNGKVKDGKHTQFRCFSASQEALFPNTFQQRWHNFQALKSLKSASQIFDRLVADLPPNVGILRWHVAGDFFTKNYLRAAIWLAESRPDVLFYGYTKSLHILRQFEMVCPPMGLVRNNFLLTGSRGGKYDHLLEGLKLREAKVVFSEAEATLDIDRDDSHAANPGGSFNLLLHGTQPAGSEASKALVQIRKGG